MLGRLHLLRGELDDARRILDETLEYVGARGLTAFQPWPQSFRAEIDLLEGDVDGRRSISSTRSPSAARSATRAGRASRREDSGSSQPGGETSRAPRSSSSTRPSSAAACPTHISGSRRTAWTPSARSPSSRVPREADGGSTSSRRSPPATACGSSSREPRSIEHASASPCAGRGPLPRGADRQSRPRRAARIGRGRGSGPLTTRGSGPRSPAGSRSGEAGARGGGRLSDAARA